MHSLALKNYPRNFSEEKRNENFERRTQEEILQKGLDAFENHFR